jgi:PAS domain S-box-containing protein
MQGNFTFCNPSCLRVLGYRDAGDLLGRHSHSLIHHTLPDGKANPAAECRIYRGFQRGEGSHVDDEVLWRQDGTSFPVEYWSYPVRRDQELVGAVVTFLDITERKRAVEALRTSEARKRAVLEVAQDAIITIDGDGRVIEVNPATERTFGWPASEMLGRELAELIVPPALRERHRKGLERHRQTGEARILGQALEMPAIRRGGEEFPVELFISRVEVEGARHFVGYIRDLTERKKAELDTRRSEERFRRLFDSNTIGIAIADLAGATLEANDAYLDMLGYTRAELRSGSLRWDDITPPEYRDADRAAVEALQRTGVAPPWEKEMLRKDGTRVPVLLGVAMLEAADASCIVYTVDLSKPRQLEKQFRQAQKMEAVGQLAGGVAHDFNNLLTAILGYTELAAARMSKDPEGLDELEEIRKAGERAAGLTRQLLAFSRRQVLEPRVLDLNAIVGDLEKMLRRLIGEDIDLVTTLQPPLGCVRADAGEIEQVIMNLALNSRDAMPEGGKITIETANVELDEAYAREHLISMRPGRYVMLAVSDTGIGMDAETQSHIFEPFFTTKPKDRGTGLGLSTVYGIVKQSGGWVWVYSEPGRGTTMKVYLPEVDEAVETIRRPVAAPPAPGTETVLLAEDEAPVRKLARRALENLGYTVLEASRGEDALSIARSRTGPIHLVLTDVVMPEMGGVDLASRIQELHPEARVLYMSGYTDDAIIRHKVLERGTHFLQKPFTPASLARKVREALS